LKNKIGADQSQRLIENFNIIIERALKGSHSENKAQVEQS